MFVGFLYVISAICLRYASQGEAFIPDTYATVGNAMKMLHLFMFLEVLHPFFGYTKVRINWIKHLPLFQVEIPVITLFCVMMILFSLF